MTTARIKLIDNQHLGSFYFTKNVKDLAEQLSEMYITAATVMTEKIGEDAAEEMFDLTNNPYRQEERERAYGRQRSVSVGDKIEVDGVEYLCASEGWVRL